MLVLNKQLTEEQRLSKAIVDIMPRIPEIAGLLMIGERVVTDDPNVPTACTNGRDEWYGREFVASLSDAELRFVILHEVFHKMYRHLITWAHLNKICPRTANMLLPPPHHSFPPLRLGLDILFHLIKHYAHII